VPHISVPEGVPGIRSLFAFRPEVAEPMSVLADVLLHAANSLTRGERELIAAHVSALNDCTFCHNSHAAVASCHLGDDGAVMRAVVTDAERAPVSAKMKALLAIAARVQRSGREVRDADIARARAEGATDIEIHDTVLIAAAFCMFNRYVDGLGVEFSSSVRLGRLVCGGRRPLDPYSGSDGSAAGDLQPPIPALRR
jgi:uncharacterized peroxidase-related enzyme